jgi:hypothetical protein
MAVTVSFVDASTFSLLGGAVGVTVDPTAGFVVVQALDCNLQPLAGATVSTNPPGTVKYDTAGTPSSGATVTDTDGLAFVFNIPAGNVDISAERYGLTFRKHTIMARPNTWTTTGVVP